MTSGDRVLARARSVIGCRFRLHGRDAQSGLDCVGLVGHAFDRCALLPTGYGFRSFTFGAVERHLAANGLDRGEGGPGDLVLLDGGAGRPHLAIATAFGVGCGVVHADIHLRRVVERPGPLPWRLVSRWRSDETGGN